MEEVKHVDDIDNSSSLVFARWRGLGIFSLARVVPADHLVCFARWTQGQEVLASASLRQPLALDDVMKGSGTFVRASTSVHSEAFSH